MTSILLGPSERPFEKSGYARTYHLLDNIDYDSISIEAVVGNASADIQQATIQSIESNKQLEYYIKAWLRIDKTLQTDSYDIYQHVNMNYPYLNPILLAGRANGVSVILGPAEGGHEVMSDSFNSFLDKFLNIELPQTISDSLYSSLQPILKCLTEARSLLFRETVRKADVVIAVASETAELYRRHAPSTRVETIPYGVDLEGYQYEPRNESHELLTVGNLLSRKGHEYLIKSLPLIISEVPDVKLHIVGTGPQKNSLKLCAEDHGVRGRVIFHGYVSDEQLTELYQKSQVFVHPSLSEGYSHVRLEAMACGCPVIGTPVPGFEDTVTDGKHGLVVPKASSQAIADAACKLFSEPGLAKEMGYHAREQIETNHDWRVITDQYESLYRELS